MNKVGAGYLWYRHTKNEGKNSKPSARSQAQMEVQSSNREVINNYQSNPNKVTKQIKKTFDLSKQDVQYWNDNVEALLQQIIDDEKVFQEEASLSTLGFGDQMFVVVEDIAARVIKNPKDLFRFDPVLQNLLPGFSNTVSEYTKTYHDNLIANDPKTSQMLEETLQQLQVLASAIQKKYRECLSSNSQSLSDAMSFSKALIHTESERTEQQKQASSVNTVSVEDLLKK